MTKQEMADLIEEMLVLVSHHPGTADLVARGRQAVKEAKPPPKKIKQQKPGGG